MQIFEYVANHYHALIAALCIFLLAFPFLRLYARKLYIIHFDKSPLHINLYSHELGERVDYVFDIANIHLPNNSMIEQTQRQEDAIRFKRQLLVYKRCNKVE